MSFTPGLVLNERYEIRAALPAAQGRAAFRALDLRLGRDARIQAFELPVDAADLPALDRRTHALAGLQHPQIRSFQDVGMLRREGYVVTPWLAGFTLAELSPMPAIRLRAWVHQGVAALQAAHAQGIIHGALEESSLVEVPGLGVLLQDFALPSPGSASPEGDLMALGRVLRRSLADAPDEALREALDALDRGQVPTDAMPNPMPCRPALWQRVASATSLVAILGFGAWATSRLVRSPARESASPERRNEARRFYLEGRHHWNRRSKLNLLKAEAALKQAIAIDPDYAQAYVALAECQALSAVFGNATPDEAIAQTRATLRDLARVDPANRECTVVEAYLLFRYEHRWKEAEALFRKGLEPGSPSASDPTRLHWFGFFLSCMGRHEEALSWLERAVALEPLNLQARTNLAVALAWANRREEALATFQGIKELDPHFNSATDRIRGLYESWGNLEEALRIFESQSQGDPVATTTAQALRDAFSRRGARGYWERRLWEFQEWQRTGNGDPYFEAYAQAALGNRDGAFAALDKALARNSPYLVWAYQDPGLVPLRTDPRFRELLRRLNLP